MAQLAGVVTVGAFVFWASFLGWKLLKAIIGIRVSAEEEFAGLDIGEHGIMAYPEFQAPGDSYPAVNPARESVSLTQASLATKRKQS